MKASSTSVAVMEMQMKSRVRYHLTPARMDKILKRERIINGGEDVEKGENLHTVGGNVN